MCLKGAATAAAEAGNECDRFLLKRNDNVLLMRIISRGGAFKGTASSLQVFFLKPASTVFTVKKQNRKIAVVVTPIWMVELSSSSTYVLVNFKRSKSMTLK